jgi:membrane-associated phospholipid phosphatase
VEFLTVIGYLLLAWSIVQFIARFIVFRHGKTFAGEVLSLLDVAVIGLGVPCYFYAVALTIYKRSYFDAQLVEVDTLLLGWAFPQGQVSLFLDQSDSLNPETFIGKLYSEVLMLTYMTYYIWPYLVTLIPTTKILLRYLKKDIQTEEQHKENWRVLKVTAAIWAISYLTVFLINSLVPASSPRIYFDGQYEHPITGFGLAGKLQGMAKENRSANSFPSGHVAETLAASLAAFFVVKMPILGGFMLVNSFLMMLATVMMRYHYFVDMLAGFFIGVGSFAIGYIALTSTWRVKDPEELVEIVFSATNQKYVKFRGVSETDEDLVSKEDDDDVFANVDTDTNEGLDVVVG